MPRTVCVFVFVYSLHILVLHPRTYQDPGLRLFSTRRMAYRPRPPDLDDIGAIAMIHWGSGVAVTWDLSFLG
jgi:hypothetical protein